MNETHYRRLRADLVGLLDTPDEFDHLHSYHRGEGGVCTACRVKMLATGATRIDQSARATSEDIAVFLDLPLNEADALYRPSVAAMRRGGPWKGAVYLQAAIAHLDEVATRHGLRQTDPRDAEARFLSTVRADAAEAVARVEAARLAGLRPFAPAVRYAALMRSPNPGGNEINEP